MLLIPMLAGHTFEICIGHLLSSGRPRDPCQLRCKQVREQLLVLFSWNIISNTLANPAQVKGYTYDNQQRRKQLISTYLATPSG